MERKEQLPNQGKETQERTRRDFVKIASTAAGIGLMGGFVNPCRAQGQTATGETVSVKPPFLSIRVLDSSQNTAGNVTEVTHAYEIIGSNDVRAVVTGYLRKQQGQGQYEVVHTGFVQFYKPTTTTSPVAAWTSTSILTGQEGEVSNGKRRDTIASRSIINGAAGEQTTRIQDVLLESPYAGMPPDQILANLYPKLAAQVKAAMAQQRK
jgi:hypothetical protein